MPNLRKRKADKERSEGADATVPPPRKSATSPPIVASLSLVPSRQKAGFDFFNCDTMTLAKKLLGQVLVSKLSPSSERTAGVIVETEAYPGGSDQASSSFEGNRTKRNEALFHPAATFCVHYTYGRLSICNVSSKEDGGGVLIRALEPVEGVATMCQNRGVKVADEGKPERKTPVSVSNGPAKLSQAMGITRDNANMLSLVDSDKIFLELVPQPATMEVIERPRVGIDATPEEWRNKLWRFYIKTSRFVSRK